VIKRPRFNGQNKTWVEEDIIKLKEVGPYLFPEEMSLMFPNRRVSAVRNMCKELNIPRTQRKIFYPRVYDNVADGNYVSGLVDGEGFFTVTISERHRTARFRFGMNLRTDDKAILIWLQSYFDAGEIYDTKRFNPLSCFNCNGLYYALSRIIPHFNNYPLRAKKKMDFELWAKMVQLQSKYYRISMADADWRLMLSLHSTLMLCRKFKKEEK
jgi:hypothetical protein